MIRKSEIDEYKRLIDRGGRAMKQTTKWNLTVTADLGRRVRRYLDDAGHKGELSLFVEEAVRARLLQLSMKTVPVYKKPSANDVATAPPTQTASITKLGDGRHGG
jgi:Ribbon-helix-helix domain